ncbi:MAG: enoyl-CoA hydratase/isomerase family protein [Mycobacterium sp.]
MRCLSPTPEPKCSRPAPRRRRPLPESAEGEPVSENGSRPSPEELILYEKDPKTKIATITFNRPEYLNAPTSMARLRYADLLRAATVDNDVKVVVIRGVGDNLGSGADLPEFMEGYDNTDLRLAELRLEDDGVGEVNYPPAGTFRSGATISAWYANVQAGNRPLQELKKISIVEAKGYCYGWHFYQCADADLVISSDDALFGHPSFRYYGWGPRMWTWVQMMGLRKFQEMVFTGRPFTAAEMYDCNFLNKVVSRDQLEAEVDKYARACTRNRPVDTVFQQKMFFEIYKQHQGEYMGSLLSAFFESMGSGVAKDDADDLDMMESIDSGLAAAVNDNDSKFPPDFRLSKSNREKDK